MPRRPAASRRAAATSGCRDGIARRSGLRQDRGRHVAIRRELVPDRGERAPVERLVQGASHRDVAEQRPARVECEHVECRRRIHEEPLIAAARRRAARAELAVARPAHGERPVAVVVVRDVVDLAPVGALRAPRRRRRRSGRRCDPGGAAGGRGSSDFAAVRCDRPPARRRGTGPSTAAATGSRPGRRGCRAGPGRSRGAPAAPGGRRRAARGGRSAGRRGPRGRARDSRAACCRPRRRRCRRPRRARAPTGPASATAPVRSCRGTLPPSPAHRRAARTGIRAVRGTCRCGRRPRPRAARRRSPVRAGARRLPPRPGMSSVARTWRS